MSQDSLPELPQVTGSSRNSEVNSLQSLYSAQKLLQRKAEESYLEEWTALLRQDFYDTSWSENLNKEADEQSVVIFFLAGEWFAIATAVCAEIAEIRPIHQIPHSASFIGGLLNLRGQLSLSIMLHNLLQLEDKPSENQEEQKKFARMVAITKGKESWIFPVMEVYGIFHYSKEDLQNVPVTVSKSTANYLRGVINWEGKQVAILDEDLLFQTLHKGTS